MIRPRRASSSRSISRWIKHAGVTDIADIVLLWAMAGVATAIGVGPIGRIAFHAPTLRATFETGTTLCSLIGASLFGISFVHRRRLRDLLLLGVLVAAAVVNIASYWLLAAFGGGAGGLVAMPLTGALLVSAGLAAAAFVSPNASFPPGCPSVALAAGAGILAGAAAEVCASLLPGQLVAMGGMRAHGLEIAALHPLGVAVTVAAATLFVAGAVRSASKPYKGDERVALLLAIGCIVLAAAALQRLTLPAFAPDRVAPVEGLRVVGYVAVLLAGLRRETAIRRSLAAAAVTAERRRVAHDLHDGLAQDLAFIAAETSRLSDDFGFEHPLTIAAKRAFVVSRGTIIDLSEEAPIAAHHVHSFERLTRRRTVLHSASDRAPLDGGGVGLEVLSH